jgi:DNA-binding response OmpR family regulator
MNQTIPETAATIVIGAASPADGQELADLLRSAQFQTYTAGSGAACVELARQVRPDLILAGVDGPLSEDFSICQALKSNSDTRHIPIIAVTAQTEAEFVAQLFAAGAIDFVFKPIRPAELICRVKRLLVRPAEGLHRSTADSLPSIATSARKICHELNQPLQYVLGSVQLLMMDIAPENPLHGSLGNIRLQVERMGQLNARLMETIRSMAPV